MNIEVILTLILLGLVALLFIVNIIPIDVIALLVLVILGLSKLLTAQQLFLGFASEATIALVTVMIISKGLENTGISVKIASSLLKLSKKQPQKIFVLLLSISGILASFMRSMGTIALLLPVVSKLSKKTGINKSYFLMPMSFCSILGGMLTMVGTGPLIILNSLLKNYKLSAPNDQMHLYQSFSLFSIMPIGITLLAVGILYLILACKPYLKKTSYKNEYKKNIQDQFTKLYDKGGNIFEINIPANSKFNGFKLDKIEEQLPSQLSIIGIKQKDKYHIPPLRNIILKENDSLAILGKKKLLNQIVSNFNCTINEQLISFKNILQPDTAGVCEAVVPQNSPLIGIAIKELHMRRNYNVQVLALARGNKAYHGQQLRNMDLKAGDTLGMYSKWNTLRNFAKNSDFFVLTTPTPTSKMSKQRNFFAILSFIIPIYLVLVQNFSIPLSLMVGACGMILCGAIKTDEAYSIVSWKTVALIAGLLPLGIAIQTSGTAAWLVNILNPYLINTNPFITQLCLAVCATLLALIISNIGATVLLVPIAIDIANNYGIAPRIYALTVALAASNTFLIPTHQTNALIAGPGAYSTSDFLKVGSLMTIIYLFIIIFWLQFI